MTVTRGNRDLGVGRGLRPCPEVPDAPPGRRLLPVGKGAGQRGLRHPRHLPRGRTALADLDPEDCRSEQPAGGTLPLLGPSTDRESLPGQPCICAGTASLSPSSGAPMRTWARGRPRDGAGRTSRRSAQGTWGVRTSRELTAELGLRRSDWVPEAEIPAPLRDGDVRPLAWASVTFHSQTPAAGTEPSERGTCALARCAHPPPGALPAGSGSGFGCAGL